MRLLFNRLATNMVWWNLPVLHVCNRWKEEVRQPAKECITRHPAIKRRSQVIVVRDHFVKDEFKTNSRKEYKWLTNQLRFFKLNNNSSLINTSKSKPRLIVAKLVFNFLSLWSTIRKYLSNFDHLNENKNMHTFVTYLRSLIIFF